VTAGDVFLHVPPLVVVPPEVVRVNAVHEIGHAIVGVVLGMALSSVSVAQTVRFGQSAQSVGRAVFLRNVWARRTKEHYVDIITMTMAGMAAEQLLLGCWDDGAAGGAGSDLHEVPRGPQSRWRGHTEWDRSSPRTARSTTRSSISTPP
jgi:hypothetical protein